MTDGPRPCLVADAKAPWRQFRVVFWTTNADGTRSGWIDDDFPTRSAARARAKAIAEGGAKAAVYDDKRRAIFVAAVPGTPDTRVMTVTRLCGLADAGRRRRNLPEEGKHGQHRVPA